MISYVKFCPLQLMHIHSGNVSFLSREYCNQFESACSLIICYLLLSFALPLIAALCFYSHSWLNSCLFVASHSQLHRITQQSVRNIQTVIREVAVTVCGSSFPLHSLKLFFLQFQPKFSYQAQSGS